MSELRTPERRTTDVLGTLQGNPDAWLATAGGAGDPRLIAVATVWDGSNLTMATRAGSPTAKNLRDTRHARLAIGTPDDVVMIEVTLAETFPAASAPVEVASRFRDGAGWDPAEEGEDWHYFILRPVRIQAYRGYGELEGRDVMRDGAWLVRT